MIACGHWWTRPTCCAVATDTTFVSTTQHVYAGVAFRGSVCWAKAAMLSSWRLRRGAAVAAIPKGEGHRSHCRKDSYDAVMHGPRHRLHVCVQQGNTIHLAPYDT